MKKAILAAITIGAGAAYAQGNPPQFVEGEVLIEFNQQAKNTHLQDALQRAGLVVQEQIDPANPGIVRAKTKLPVLQAIAALERHPAINIVEPNYVYTHSAVATDPYYNAGYLWGTFSDDKPAVVGPPNTTSIFGSQAEEAWNRGHVGSAEVMIGVIDEGIQYYHQDLHANAWTNPGESGLDLNGQDKSRNGVDDDRNGYVDDIHGWDFHHGDNSIFDAGAPNDFDGCTDNHGTHVAGTICAMANNGVGIAGMVWNAKFISGKFLGPNGGTTDNAYAAVKYFASLKRAGVKLVAINNSWGGGGYSRILHNAIKEIGSLGVTFVCATGNSGWDIDRWASYPANYDTRSTNDGTTGLPYDAVLAVTAIDKNGSRPQWANYGKVNADLGAPGVGILSTVPGGIVNGLPSSAYAYYDGTSMATPHVTGAIALYASTQLNVTGALPGVQQVREAVLNAAKSTPTKSLYRRTATGGRLNVSGF